MSSLVVVLFFLGVKLFEHFQLFGQQLRLFGVIQVAAHGVIFIEDHVAALAGLQVDDPGEQADLVVIVQAAPQALRKVSDVQSVQSDLMLALQLGQLPHARRCLKALIADVPYSNKKLASMDMEERYRLIMSTIFNAIGCHVEVEHMMANGRIDMVVEVTHFIYVMELKLTNNGGLASAERQIRDNCYTAPFRADKRKVIALAVELDDQGKGLIDWKEVTT